MMQSERKTATQSDQFYFHFPELIGQKLCLILVLGEQNVFMVCRVADHKYIYVINLRHHNNISNHAYTPMSFGPPRSKLV